VSFGKCLRNGLAYLSGVHEKRVLFVLVPTKAGHSESGRDLAVFPLAMPYLAGPATTLAVMVATQQETFDPGVLAAKIGVLALVMVSTVVSLLSSGRIQKILGHTGSAVIGRVMGILLAALAAESVVRGVTEAFRL
jgi:multiple antibiotic resistance protein